MGITGKYTKEECLQALNRASKQVEGSISEPQYRELNMTPSSASIKRRFGSWNNAKEEAGIKLSLRGGAVNINRKFFKNIDAAKKAYWLGFLFGDGCISRNRVGNWRLSIGINKADKKHLYKFKKDTDARVNVKEGEELANIEITDNDFVQHLRNLGCDEVKTHSSRLPEITNHCLRGHFLRGLIDADGYVGSYHNHHRLELIQSKKSNRLENLQEWISFNSKIRVRQSSKLMSIGRKKDVEPLIGWLYPQGRKTEPSLERKKDTIFERKERTAGDKR